MTETPMTVDLALPAAVPPALPAAPPLPGAIAAAGPAAGFAWEEFFAGQLRNPHTRAAYRHAVQRFFAWLQPQAIPLHEITPAMVGRYFDQHPGSPPTRKLHLAAIRRLFDLFVTRHLMVLNPAACIRGERYSVVEGKTPEISLDHATQLLKSIGTATPVRLRDRAAIGVMLFTAARAGAIAKLRRRDYSHDGSQWTLRFEEKGGKSREIPVQHNLERLLAEYLQGAQLENVHGATPLFRSAWRTSGRLTDKAMTGVDMCRMVKRRLKDAGLPDKISPHSFRAFTATDLLTQGVPLNEVQYLLGHSDSRTTALYDRRNKRVGRQLVERISIDLDRDQAE
jgi:site-specific recombinase XerD